MLVAGWPRASPRRRVPLNRNCAQGRQQGSSTHGAQGTHVIFVVRHGCGGRGGAACAGARGSAVRCGGEADVSDKKRSGDERLVESLARGAV